MEINTKFYPVQTVHGQRVDLKEITMDNASALFELRSSDDVMQYIERPRTKNIQEAMDMIQKMDEFAITGNGFTWGVFLKGSNTMIGTMGFYRIEKENLRGEVGYLSHPDYWGKGLMSEALKLALDIGFNQIKFHSIAACINPKNESSRKLLLKHHFQKEAYHRENLFFNNKFYDSEIFALLVSDYRLKFT